MKELTPDQRAEVLERHLHDEGHVDSAAIDRTVAAREDGGGPSPALGARIVARAWTDPEFKTRLLANGTATVSELARQLVPIAVLEDTPERHHVIVCTLCSCYPGGVLGDPPSWYKSFEYRSRVVREPRAVLAEFGMDVDDGVELRVVDSTSEQRYLVLPLRPEGTEGWPADELAALVTRDSMIGTGRPLTPNQPTT
ncbi:MAG TPA: nitrile hydratase subunit alpha [Acidimicrobiales bacterium]|nr:nitrile hydratase subunit alpha [Acidimicrobiales bacterium]